MLEIPADTAFNERLEKLKKIGTYEIIHRVGQGSRGVVFLGWDPFIKRHAAIKVAKPLTEESRRHFFVEAQSAGRLNHANIVSIYGADIYRDFCYIAMEYVEGNSLSEFCCKDNLLPPQKVTKIIFDACDALDYAHRQGIVHRDIKPSNILFSETETVKITDFGMAAIMEDTAEMGVFGTPSYIAPEQLENETPGKGNDIFSLGCVLYELLSGQQAFPGEEFLSILYKITHTEPASIQKLRPDLPDILDQIIRKALIKEPGQRYATCMDFADDLRVALRAFTETYKEGEIKDVIDYINHLPFFHSFTKDEVKELASLSEMVKLPAEEIILEQGQTDDAFYIILRGRIKVKKDNKNIALIGEGECFGESAHLGRRARLTSLVADTDCFLMKISFSALDRLPSSIQLHFYEKFIMMLTRRLSHDAIVKVSY